jgi:ribonuclease J
MIKLHTIGGYDEVGRNMTALELDGDSFIFDCGLFLPPIVEMEDSLKKNAYTEKMLRSIDAVPNDLILDKLGITNKVKALLITHAHLDHVGAVPFLAGRYPNSEIAGTPFTIEVLKTLIRDNEARVKNPLRVVSPNSSFKSGKYKIEFINMTHSTLQTAMIAVHTEKGVVLYANDFKFDNFPIVGKKPNYERLIELGNEGVLALIVDSLYSGDERKTPSEKIARDLLEDVMLGTNNKDGCIIITTFSSHIARLKSIVDFGKQLNRKILFLGRSLHKYVGAASNLQLAPFMNDIEIVTYANQIKRKLKQIERERNKWLIVCTGHQGEPDSVLDKLSRDYWPFNFSSKDHVIFSSRIIPSAINIANRSRLEKKLKEKGVRIFTDVHTSGHCGREDLRDLITMVKPKHIIPAHGDLEKRTPLAELAGEMGYKLGETLHLLQNGQALKLE